MPNTPDGPAVSTPYPRRLYRWHRLGFARRPTTERKFPPEGTMTTPEGAVLEYLTVSSPADETDAAQEGWTDLATTIARGAASPLPVDSETGDPSQLADGPRREGPESG
jgi:hypothetical protein